MGVAIDGEDGVAEVHQLTSEGEAEPTETDHDDLAAVLEAGTVENVLHVVDDSLSQ
jgi:hypothetical protein